MSRAWTDDWDSPEDSVWDWIDDDTLSPEETERRFDELMAHSEPVEVVHEDRDRLPRS